jgi:hypothetical protein
MEAMTEAVAAYGAIVGTVAAIASAVNIYKNRAIVRLKISQLMPTSSFPHWCLALTAVNHGWRPVTLDGGGLECEDGWIIIMPSERHASFFPAELKEGKSHMIWFTVDELRDALRKNQAQHGKLKYGFFGTSTGQRFRRRLSSKSPILKHAAVPSESRGTKER